MVNLLRRQRSSITLLPSPLAPFSSFSSHLSLSLIDKRKGLSPGVEKKNDLETPLEKLRL